VSLQDWLTEGHLKTHQTSKQEISQLIAVFERDFADAQVKALSTDRRLSTAYSATLSIAIAALAVYGFRAASEGHHYWSIQSLAFTLQTDKIYLEKFHKFRHKRNISDYERIGMASERDVAEMLNMAKILRSSLEECLKNDHPDLI
jgi:hypothetical protein